MKAERPVHLAFIFGIAQLGLEIGAGTTQIKQAVATDRGR